MICLRANINVKVQHILWSSVSCSSASFFRRVGSILTWHSSTSNTIALWHRKWIPKPYRSTGPLPSIIHFLLRAWIAPNSGEASETTSHKLVQGNTITGIEGYYSTKPMGLISSSHDFIGCLSIMLQHPFGHEFIVNINFHTFNLQRYFVSMFLKVCPRLFRWWNKGPGFLADAQICRNLPVFMSQKDMHCIVMML